MQEQQRTYIAIDLKSFYASVECVDRGIDPLTTNLVEPRSQDFQSCAYTKSAKVPNVVAPDGFEPPPPDPESDVLTVTPWSNL